YGTMANGGIHIPPHAIETISASDGHVIYQAQAKGTRALSPGAAFMVTDVLSDGAAHASACSPYQLYTATAAQCRAGNPGSIRPAAVIGGLSETFRDTMAIGYTTDLVAGTWAGNSDYSLMEDVTSNDGAGQIWHDAMLLAEGNMPIKQFPSPPADVVKKTVNYGNLTTTDWYLASH
ncbi:MAG: hypothetical protein J2P36_31135, partial [Ktedonobacteraceae bacterium]|nr:hypothetical protein [Ktedonobacteraceae bacterium]